MKSIRWPGLGWLGCSACHHAIIDHVNRVCIECGCERAKRKVRSMGMDMAQLPDMEASL